MRALFAITASLLAASAWVTLFACGDDAANPTDDGGSSGSSGSLGGEGGPGGDGSGTQPGDAGPDAKRAQNGCLLFTTGIKSGAKAENVPRTDISGAIDWTNPTGAIKEDDQTAKVVINDGQESAFLRVSDFGITLPPKVEVWGIVVRLQRQEVEDGGRLRTSKVDIQIGKTTQFKFDKLDFYWPIPIVGTHDYGQEVDTWGANIDPTDFTTPSFAAILAVTKWTTGGLGGPVTGVVDALKVAIWYADGDGDHCTR